MPPAKQTSNRTAWLLALLFLPAVSLVLVLSLPSYRGRTSLFLTLFFIYFIHRLIFSGVTLGLSLRGLRVHKHRQPGKGSASVSVAIPAYNEADVIVACVRSVANQSVPPEEIIVVNDGSTDDTLERLRQAFCLERAEENTAVSAPGLSVYRGSPNRLTVIDKRNGGKPAALNAALEIASGSVFVTIDADTLLHPNALEKLVESLMSDDKIVAAGGMLKPANGVTPEMVALGISRLPPGLWARLQWIEYTVAFFGRFGWALINTLVSISGAFTAFRTTTLRRCGGFDTNYVTGGDDYEVAYRLHVYHLERQLDYAIIAVPDALAFTLVPDTARSLIEQRIRWFQGFFQTIFQYRRVAGRPRFRGLGIFMVPFKFFDAAENCWAFVTFPLLVCYIVFDVLPIPLLLLVQLVLLKMVIHLFMCWLLLGLHQRHLAPRLTFKPLLLLMALAPVYVIANQFLGFAYVAGYLRSRSKSERWDKVVRQAFQVD